MNISRREFLQMLAVASAAGIQLPGQAATRKSVSEEKLYDLPAFGNVSLLHFTDCHAQLMPVWFREPNINIGIAGMKANAPHLVGNHFLTRYGINPNSPQAHAFTYLNFVEASKKFGKIGGFSHLATLIKHIQAQRPDSVLLDGGDTWQGSATSLWTDGQDMVDATKLLGVDAMTGHWEFTFGAKRVKEIIEKDLDGHMDFLAQNVIDNQWEEDVFKPYVIKEINGIPTAIVGQAFPYTPIANPRYMVPDWSFGIREDKMQQTVDAARKAGAQVVVLLSHNGMDVDLKMASRVVGIDAIMGGHTHDAVPEPVKVKNNGGITLVINSGSNSKFLSVLDFDVRKGKVRDFRYSLLPIFSNLLEPDVAMSKHIENVRKPYIEDLEEELGIADELLYRRGNFNGSFDQLILDALMEAQDADIAFSPGFRWGTSVLPGEPITFEHVMSQTAITYPTTTLSRATGETIKLILEDVADNLFNTDPYYQQGGDMVRVGGLKYSIDPTKKIGYRITDMELNGKPLDPNKKYRVAGWASVKSNKEGIPIWDVTADYIRNQDTVKVGKLNTPKIKGIKDNPGLAGL
ncbi:MAG: thiosulfohydrolase SoxB [Ectothiorhodospiraceae bacterium]|nr:thiosulfohydrolase SoxB [Ectothiorhodospiraceae bacterium]